MKTRARFVRAAKDRTKSTLGRKLPGIFGPGRYQTIPGEYRLKDLILTENGEVPLTWFTYKSNFGDLMSPWLLSKMTGRQVVRADTERPHYVMVGSIINKGTPQSIFWGTGTYGTEGKKEVCAESRYTAVRGPLTRSKLGAAMAFGIDVPQVYGDPALLAPLYYFPKVKVTHDFGVVVRWRERSWAKAKYGPGVKLIDFARGDVEEVIRDMLSCKKILSSSLHGLIVADAYGIPNAWLESGTPRGGEFKFHDYFASVHKLRAPQAFRPDAQEVTAQVLQENIHFDARPITFNYRKLLDACPFLTRA
ncbi:polysaccharide pyruvyl transferase family protein [Brevibacterium linens]|uniref:Polysaccharide pyruvyl transferase n=1 Tax=Brevibacterium linens TaxID=1703 RepID=A0A0B9AX13_BRELN|nr:polysaccharide pyruvyl transferase family protein [Brevibacterium linens]KHS53866.1 polysaccharide pyruvyl transferase [Brevibacterium linens]